MADRGRKRTRSPSQDDDFVVGDLVEVVDDWYDYSFNQEAVRDLGLTNWARGFRSSRGVVGVVVAVRRRFSRPARETFVLVGIHVAETRRDFAVFRDGLRKFKAPVPPAVPAVIMQHMWNDRSKTGDASLSLADDKVVKAHSCVLAAASPVFAAAFTTGMQEKATKDIRLPDVDISVVQGVVECLYLGSLPGDLDPAAVLKFAHMYSIVEVAKQVGPKLIRDLNLESCAEIVRLLRDFDKMGCNFIDDVWNTWKCNRNMMRLILADV